MASSLDLMALFLSLAQYPWAPVFWQMFSKHFTRVNRILKKKHSHCQERFFSWLICLFIILFSNCWPKRKKKKKKIFSQCPKSPTRHLQIAFFVQPNPDSFFFTIRDDKVPKFPHSRELRQQTLHVCLKKKKEKSIIKTGSNSIFLWSHNYSWQLRLIVSTQIQSD